MYETTRRPARRLRGAPRSLLLAATLLSLTTCELFKVGLGAKVDVTPPVVTVETPSRGAYVGASIIISGIASDDTALAAVRLQMKVGSGTWTEYDADVEGESWSFSLDSSTILPTGSTGEQVDLVATARDESGKTASDAIRFYIDDAPPELWLVEPTRDALVPPQGSGALPRRLDNVVRFTGGAKDFGGSELVVTMSVKLTDPEYADLPAIVKTASGTTSWSLDFDSLAFLRDDLGLDSSAYEGPAAKPFSAEFVFSAQDPAGNRREEKIEGVVIDQDADAPLLTLRRFGVERSTAAEQPVALPVPFDPSQEQLASFTLVVEDDDAVDLSSISVKARNSGTEADMELSVLSSVTTKSDQQGRPLSVTREYRFPVGTAEGNYELSVSASDDASSKTGPNPVAVVRDLSGFDLRAVLDTGAPVLTETAVGTKSTVVMTASYVLEGRLTDGSAIHPTTPLVVSINGGAAQDLAVGPDGFWRLERVVESDGSTDGTYSFSLTAMDAAGKIAQLQRNVRVDAAAPSIAVFAPLEGAWLSSSALEARGEASDGAGLGVTKVEWSPNAAGPWTPAIGTTSWRASVNLGAIEGAKSLYLLATDAAGHQRALRVDFGLDLNKPELGASTPPTSVNTGFLISGTASDTNALSAQAVVVTQKKGSGSPVTISVNGASTTDGWATWSLSGLPRDPGSIGEQVLGSAADGVYEYSITATDAAGKTQPLARIVRFDATPGEVSVTSPPSSPNPSNTVGGTSFTFAGSASDGGSGVKRVQYSFDGTSWSQAAGTESWTATVSLPVLGAEGPKALYVRVEDNAGNLSPPTMRNFVYDTAVPTLGVAGAANRAVNTGFSLGGVAFDAYGLAGIAVTQSKDGGAAVPIIADGPASGDGWATWSLANLPRKPTSIGMQEIDDGVYVYEITATDLAGKQSLPQIVTVRIDRTAPETNIVVAPITGKLGENALSGSSYTLKGSATDSGVGVARVWILMSAQPSAPAGTVGYTEIASSGDWSHVLDFDTDGGGPDTGLAEGRWYLHVKAEDTSGNRTADSAATTVAFDVDHAHPSLTELAVGTNAIRNTRTGFVLSGALGDSHGVASLVVTQKKDSGAVVELTEAGPASNGVTWILSALPRDPSMHGSQLAVAAADGLYEYVITVTDLAGKTTSVTRTLRFDATPPELSLSSPAASEIVAVRGGTNYTLRGSVGDAGSGLKRLEYAFDASYAGAVTVANPGLTWSATIPAAVFGAQGPKTLYLRAIDNLDQVSEIVRAFSYDYEDPVLAETSVASEDQRIVNSPLVFAGTASDSYALAGLTVAVNGADPVPISVSGGVWTWTLPSTTEGAFSLVFEAIDLAGRATRLKRSALMDTTPPPAPAINAFSSFVAGNLLNASGSATDALSGLQALEYRVDGGAWLPLNGTGAWYGDIDVSLRPQGANVLEVRATDRAGNVSPVGTRQYVVDRADPSISSLAPAGLSTKVDLLLSGSAEDSNPQPLQSVTATRKKGSEDPVAQAVTGTGSWSIAVPTSLGDGSYLYTVTVTDAVGRQSSLQRTVVIDTTPPSAAISYPGADAVLPNASITIAGTASDAGAGLAAVEYSLDNLSWHSVSGTSDWNRTVNLGSEGRKTLYVRSRDLLGTLSATESVSFDLDLSPPNLTETRVGVLSPRRSAEFSLYGEASDTNGLKTWNDPLIPGVDATQYVEVSVNGGAAQKVSVVGGYWTYLFSQADLGLLRDGVITFAIVATDIVDKPTTISRSVTVDLTAPTVVVDGFTSGKGAGNALNGAASLRFSADDSGVGLERSGASYVAYYKVVADGASNGGTSVAMAGWSSITSSSQVFNLPLDTTAYADGDWDLWLAVRDNVTGGDNVPNVLPELVDLLVDQESDRPTIAFDNLDVSAAFNYENGFGQNPVILLTVSDDDKVDVSELQYRIDVDNDGLFASAVELGTAGNKWENEVGDSGWYPVYEGAPPADGAFVQAKIFLTGIPQGAFRLQVRARDNVGAAAWTGIFDEGPAAGSADSSWNKSAVIRFAVDYGPPSISVSAPASGAYRSDFAVSGLATDALSVISVDYTIDGGSSYVNLFAGSATSAPFSGTVDVDSLPTGEYILQVEATDFGGTTATQQIPITIDRTGPAVSVLQPAGGGVLNGASVALRGEAYDNRQLGAVYYWNGLVGASDPALPSLSATPQAASTMVSGGRYKIASVGDTLFTGLGASSNAAGVSFTATGPGAGSGTVFAYESGGYVLASGTSVWNGTIDTSATILTAADGYRIRTVGVDALGNVGTPVDLLLGVDQETDRPVLGFSNLSLATPSKLPASVNVAFYGNVTDDDLVESSASVEVRIDRNGDGDFLDANEGWAAASTPPSADAATVSWSHEASLTNEGRHFIQVRARQVSAPSHPADPAVYDGAYATSYGWGRSAPVEFYIDNGPPALDVTAPAAPGQKFSVNDLVFAGTTQDSTGIRRVVVWVDRDDSGTVGAGEETLLGLSFDGLTGAPLTTNNDLYTFNIPVADIPDGTKTVRITSYDSSNSATFRDLSVVVDTTPPSAAISEPAAASSTQNGSILVRGTASDLIHVSKVYWNLSLQSAGAPALLSQYNLVAGKTYAWDFTLDTTAFPDSANPDDPYVLRIVVEDGVGNTSLASPATRLVLVDQGTDKPVIDVNTLYDDVPTGSVMGGAVKNILPSSRVVSGTVKDDDLVDKTKVEIRIDYDNDGDFSDTVVETALDRDLNGDGDKLDSFAETWGGVSVPPGLDAPLAAWSHFFGLTDGRYRFQLRAADVHDDETASWQPGAHSWTESSVVPFSIDLSSPTGGITAPDNASFHRGTAGKVALSGTAADAGGVKRVTIAYDRGAGYMKQDGSAGEDLLYEQLDPDLAPLSYVWSDEYDVGHGDGQVLFRVTITDAFDKTRTYERYFTVDTTPPSTDFILPASGQAVNGTVFARGTANDTNQVTALWFKPALAADGPSSGAYDWSTDSAADLAADGWRNVGTYTWEAYFKSTLLSADYVNDAAAAIYLMAVDAAGNRSDPTNAAPAVGRNYLPIVVRQKDNLPVVTITTGAGSILDNTGYIRGTIADAQGVDKDSLEISFDNGTSWRAVSNPPAATSVSVEFSHLVSHGAGLAQRATPYQVLVRAKDVGHDVPGADFDLPFVTGQSAVLEIRKDDSDPTVDQLALDNGVLSVGSLQGAYVSKIVRLSGRANDGVGVQKVEAKLAGVDADYSEATLASPGAAVSTWTWDRTGLALAGSSQVLELKVTDVNGRVTAQSFTLLVDTTPPTVSFESTADNPATDSALYGAARHAYNGTVAFTGNAADVGSQVTKVYYRFSATPPAEPTPALLLSDWTEAAGLYRWNTADLATSGTGTTLWVVAVDAAGNLSDAVPGTPGVVDPYSLGFTIDQATDKPVVSVTAPLASQVFGENAKLQGSVIDDDGVASVEYQLDLDNDGVLGETVTEAALGRDLNGDGDLLDSFVEAWTPVASPANPGGQKSLAFEQSLSAWTDGAYRVKFRVRDSLFATSSSSWNEAETPEILFSIDTAAPTLALARLLVPDLYGGADRETTANFNGAYVNNDFVLDFVSSDASGVKWVQTSLTNQVGSWVAADKDPDALNHPHLYHANLSKSSFVDGTRTVYYRAEDNNGKLTTGLLTIIVDTAAPVVSFQSPSGMSDNPAAAAPSVNGKSVVVSGIASDPSLVESLAVTGGSRWLALPFSAMSDASPVFTPAALPDWAVPGALVRFAGLKAPGGFSTGTDYYLRDVAGGDFSLAASPGGAAIAVTDRGKGEYLLQHRFAAQAAFTNTGNETGWSLSFDSTAYDDAAASVAVGERTVQATAADDRVLWAGHGLQDGDSVYFYAATMPGGLSAETRYYVRDKRTDDFKLSTIPGGAAADIAADASLLASKTGISWRFPITVTARDGAGNRAVATAFLDLDPNADKPIVRINTPAPGDSVTGTITVSGTYSDDDGSTGDLEVLVDTDDDYDPLDPQASAFEDSYPVVATNGAWNLQINKDGFSPGLAGTVTIRVTPRDRNAVPVVGNYLDRGFFVDSSLPSIAGWDEGASLEIAAPTPDNGSRQRGKITVKALFKDDDLIPESNIQVSLDGGVGYKPVESPEIGGTVSRVSDGADGKKRYFASFDIETARAFGDQSGTGTLSVILQITDNTYKPAVLSLGYAVDNNPPEIYWDYPDPTLALPPSGRYGLFGKGATNLNRVIGSASDGTGSGISHVDVYFVKTYDPSGALPMGTYLLNPKGGDPLSASAALAADSDDLYAQVSFVPADVDAANDEITIDRSLWGRPDDSLPVRFAGSLPAGLSAGKLYYVRDLRTKIETDDTFKLFDAPTGGSPVNLTGGGSGTMYMLYSLYSAAGRPVYFADADPGTAAPDLYHDPDGAAPYAYPAAAYGIRINQRTELGANDGNANGDGDGFQELLANDGTHDDWYAYLDTTLLPDGPLTIYQVAYDKNGNKVLTRTEGQVANKPPSIVGVSVAGSSGASKLVSAVNTGTDAFTSAGHGLANGTPVYFAADSLPSGLAPLAGEPSYTGVYYVRDSAADTFKVATTAGGVPVDLTSSGVRVRVSTTSLPWKAKTVKGAAVPFGLGAQDPEGSIDTAQWDLDLLGEYGNGVSPDAQTQSLSLDYDPSGTPAGGSASFEVDLSAVTYRAGYWYRFRSTAFDTDGNKVSEEFYVRTMTGDVQAPRIRLRDLDQRAVGMWTTRTTPLSLAFTQASISGNEIKLGLPSWIASGARVRFAGDVAPAGAALHTTYFVRNITANTDFELWTAATGGAQVLLSNATPGSFLLVSGGHVEDRGTATGYDGGDADVSGAVLLTGTVYDDFKVDSLTITLDGTPAAQLTKLNGGLANERGNEIDGYTYDWSYLWDTSRIATVAKEDVVVAISASDGSNPAQTSVYYPMTEADELESGGTLVASPGITVDVVPYITYLTDPQGLSDDVLRGSTGRYSIASHPSNTLTVRGYNLGDNGSYEPTAYNSATAAGWAGGASILADTPAAFPRNQATVSKNWSRSGFLTLAVNDVPSGNNLDAEPPTAKSETLHHNDESGADPRTYRWTDDRYLWVWGVNQISISTTTNFTLGSMVYENPDMVMIGDQPSFTWNDTNAGNTVYNSTDSAATRRFGFRLTRPAATAIADVDPDLVAVNNQRFIVSGMDAVLSAAGDLQAGFMEVTGFGDVTTATAPYTDARAPSTEADGQKWMTIQGIDYYGLGGTDSKNYRVFNRFPHPKLIAETGPVNPSANIFLTYYDASPYPGFRSLNFVSFRQTGQRAGNLTYPANDYSISPDVIVIPDTDEGRSSQYFDMVRVGTNGVAIAYYDPSTSRLKLVTSTNAFDTGTNLSNSAWWEESTVNFTGVTRADYSTKYFTFYSLGTGYAVWFDTTGAQAYPGPVGIPAGNRFRIDVSALGGNGTNTFRNNVRTAVYTALTGSTAVMDAFALGNVADGTAQWPLPIRSKLRGAATDIGGTLANPTAVGAVAVTQQGRDSAATWNTITIDSKDAYGGTADVGQHVSMVYDGVSGNLFLAYNEFEDANLKMARVPWNGGSPQESAVETVYVDKYLSAGTWTNIDLIANSGLTGQATAQPVIAYYADSYNGSRKPVRFAFPKFNAASGSLAHGTESGGTSDQYSGDWEIMTLHALTVPKGGASTFNKVQFGKYGGNLPVLGWLGSLLEYGKLQPNN